jgi:hypothetical protein
MALKKTQLKGGVTRAALLGVVLIGVTAGAMVLARRGPSVLAKVTAAAESPAPDVAAPAPKRLLVGPAEGTGHAPKATPSPSRSTKATPAAKPAAKPAVVMAAATTAAPKAPVDAVTQPPEVITLTGCLQQDEGTFRLKETAGADAPKARSWKSGFLKKRAASVEVVDSANRLQLPAHVGHRVTVTGILLDREMRARAVQRVGACS